MAEGRPTLLKFYLESNEDETLTCFFCRGKSCEQSFTAFGDGDRRTIGVHNECVDRHAARSSKIPNEKTGAKFS
jgi:hypothetical protein